jgi:hypothetical protein
MPKADKGHRGGLGWEGYCMSIFRRKLSLDTWGKVTPNLTTLQHQPISFQGDFMDSRSEPLNKSNGGVVSKFLFSCVTFFAFFFLFWNVYSFGQTTGSHFSLPDNLTDKDWLVYSKVSLINDEIVRKLPIIKSELDLTQDQIDEIETLTETLGNEEFVGRGLSQEETVKERLGGFHKSNSKRVAELQTEFNKAQSDTMDEITTVRSLLGKKDLDFRFWLFEEEIIDGSNWMAYFKNHKYSPDDVIEQRGQAYILHFILTNNPSVRIYNVKCRPDPYFLAVLDKENPDFAEFVTYHQQIDLAGYAKRKEGMAVVTHFEFHR